MKTYLVLNVEPRFGPAERGRTSSFKSFLSWRTLVTEVILEVDNFLDPFLLFKLLLLGKLRREVRPTSSFSEAEVEGVRQVFLEDLGPCSSCPFSATASFFDAICMASDAII